MVCSVIPQHTHRSLCICSAEFAESRCRAIPIIEKLLSPSFLIRVWCQGVSQHAPGCLDKIREIHLNEPCQHFYETKEHSVNRLDNGEEGKTK